MSEDELICSTSDERIEVGFDEPVMFDQLQTTLYPGSILDISTIPTGGYDRVMADRVPLNLTIDPRGMRINGSTQKIVEEPNLGSVRDAQIELRDRLDPTAGEGTAQMDYTKEEVFSDAMTRTMLGAHYDGVWAEVDAHFEYEESSDVHEVLVKLQQVYYSIDVNLEHPGAFFLDGRTPAPTSAIVDRVNYGRVVLFNLRSTESRSELEAAVEATFEKGTKEGGGEIEHEQEETIETSEVHATVLGGGADTGARAVTASGVEDIHAIINDGSSYGPDHPGAPISYHMTYLIDGSEAGVTTATDYTARECEPKATTYEAYDFRLVNHNDGSGSDDVSGYIRVTGSLSDSGDDIYPREGSSTANTSKEGNPMIGDEADKQVWVRTTGSPIPVDRADEGTGLGEDAGVRELDGVTARVDFPGGAENIDYSAARLRVVSNLSVDTGDLVDFDGDFAGWRGMNVYLDDVTGGDVDYSMTFTEHGEEMELRFKVQPVFS